MRLSAIETHWPASACVTSALGFSEKKMMKSKFRDYSFNIQPFPLHTLYRR